MSPTLGRREDGSRRRRRRHRRLRAVAGVATLLVLLLGSAVIAVASTTSSTSDDGRARDPVPPLVPGEPRSDALDVRPGWADGISARLPSAPDVGPAVVALPPELASRPSARPPDALPRAESTLPPGRIRARGVATWFCLSGVSACHRDRGAGLYAAAGPALRVGAWRGRLVTVCAGARCVRVRLIDWCGCDGGRTGRVIDLYGDAFRRIAPLSRGEVRVSVRW